MSRPRRITIVIGLLLACLLPMGCTHTSARWNQSFRSNHFLFGARSDASTGEVPPSGPPMFSKLPGPPAFTDDDESNRVTEPTANALEPLALPDHLVRQALHESDSDSTSGLRLTSAIMGKQRVVPSRNLQPAPVMMPESMMPVITADQEAWPASVDGDGPAVMPAFVVGDVAPGMLQLSPAHGKKSHVEKKADNQRRRFFSHQMGLFPSDRRRRDGRDIGYNNACFPRELQYVSLPLYRVEPPDILFIEAYDLLPNREIVGERLVRQDGTISLGYYGQIHVAGLTLEQIRTKIRERLAEDIIDPQLYVDVAAFNSKVYYILGQVTQQGRLPITGKETVLDAITIAGGLTNFADTRRIHVARPSKGGGCDQILFVDYKAIVECGNTRTNYQLMPGDRVVVPPTLGFKLTVLFDNFLTPIERITSLFALVRFAATNNNN